MIVHNVSTDSDENACLFQNLYIKHMALNAVLHKQVVSKIHMKR